MYENEYEDYIRSILGYPLNYDNYVNYNNQGEENLQSNPNLESNLEIEKYYPEIYKLIYPMILKKCNEYTDSRKNMDREEIEKMTDEIYFAIEETKEVEIDLNSKNKTNQNQMVNRQIDGARRIDTRINEPISRFEKRENRQMNNTLRDLIKILLIRELLNRLQRPGRVPPPPYIPPRPPMMGPIPPFIP